MNSINHHPSDNLLEKFCSAELPETVLMAISAHVEFCPECQQKIKQITESQGNQFWTLGLSNNKPSSTNDMTLEDDNFHSPYQTVANQNNETGHQAEITEDNFYQDNNKGSPTQPQNPLLEPPSWFIDENIQSMTNKLDQMLNLQLSATALDEVSADFLLQRNIDNLSTDPAIKNISTNIDFMGDEVTLPKALRCFKDPAWKKVGSVLRARLLESGDGSRANLLQIAAGQSIPEHTHKGYEITLILSGDMFDEDGKYGVGDFLLRNQRDRHNPQTEKGCLCFTVADAPPHFVKGFSRLLNPIGQLFY